MTYDRVVFLKKTGTNRWALYSDKGHQLTEDVFYSTRNQAVDWANAWISSFNSIRLVVQDETN